MYELEIKLSIEMAKYDKLFFENDQGLGMI